MTLVYLSHLWPINKRQIKHTENREGLKPRSNRSEFTWRISANRKLFDARCGKRLETFSSSAT